MTRHLILLCCSVALIACGTDEAPEAADTFVEPQEVADPNLEPPPEGQGFQLTMEATAEPYSELWLCEVKPIPITKVAAVNWVEVKQNGGTHHLTLSTLGFASAGKLAHGRYDCRELYGDKSLMSDQIMFYGNQGVAHETMKLPKGIAATLPPTIDVIHEIHYVNATDKPIDLYSRINAWTIPDDEFEAGIWGGSVRDEHINIPKEGKHTEWTRCVFNKDVDVLFLASHTHALGVDFTIARYDGETTGDIFYSNTDWHIPLISQYEPSLKVKAGQGFEWACTWDNTTGEPVNYGNNSTDEMCNLAVVFTPMDLGAACEVVESSDGVLWKP